MAGFATPNEELVLNSHKLISQLWGLTKMRPAPPFALPNTLTRIKLHEIRSEPREWFVSPKLNGERCYLLFGWFGGWKYCVLVNRRGTVVPHRVEADRETFAGTLLDGEWMEEKKEFHVFDAVAIRGRSCIQLDYTLTLDEIRKEIATYRPVTFHILLKTIYLSSAVPPTFVSHIRDGILHNVYDGIVFTKNSRRLHPGFNAASMFKFKEEHTIDVGVIDASLDMYVALRGEMVPGVPPHWGRSPKLRLAWSAASKHVPYVFPAVVEVGVAIVEKDDKLICECTPIRVRTDKTLPNSIPVIVSVIEALEENIRMEETVDEH